MDRFLCDNGLRHERVNEMKWNEVKFEDILIK